MPPAAKQSCPPAPAFQQALLAWYDAHKRPLPWRATNHPYPIWVAEIMLQQTTVAAVIPYYKRFLARFPSLPELAQAQEDEVLHLWQGLGYYRRARLLHRCAHVLVREHGGTFPTTPEALKKLPGFGPYTSAVVAACAFNTPAVVIDGNVLRVISRICALSETLTPTHRALTHAAATLAAGAPPRAYANAIMELGALVCTPIAPRCETCPVEHLCAARAAGNPTSYPIKPTKPGRPEKFGTAYVLTDPHGNLWLRQRPPEGLLGNLWEVPHTGWESPSLSLTLPENTDDCGTIRHVFTHFALTLEVRRAVVKTIPAGNAFALHNLPPLSTLMRKVLRAGGIRV